MDADLAILSEEVHDLRAELEASRDRQAATDAG